MNDEAEHEALERRLISLQEKNGRLTSALTAARTELIRLQGELADISRPPQTLATFVRAYPSSRQIEVVTGGKRMRVAVSSKLDVADLSYGQWVRLDDTMVAVAADGFARSGQVVSVLEMVGDDRVLVATEGGAETLLELAGPLCHGNLRPGDSLVANPRAGIALERIVREDVEQLLTPEIPDVTYADIGGLDEQIAQVRDSIEMPFNHPDLYRRFGLRPPKGILLYGPPGSGKTLIAKAVANSLSKRGGASTFFLSIKGPELLNKFVGETERQIRAIFARARTLAATDTPVVVFFDEMEALFRTRGTGVSSDVETMIVPQLLAEMDGVESLDNVVIIGASNRADMIDPAVLRPGRLDVRIRVDRPDRAGALDIFSKYLTPAVPISAVEIERFGGVAEAAAGMSRHAVDALYARNETTALFLATLVSGDHKRIYLSDLVSGALIAGIVERAKKYAIKDALSGASNGLSMEHLLHGVHEEMAESLELAATSSPEDWARTSGLAPEIVSVKPIGTIK
ncbi:proteasome ATPase [Actinomyces sp. HMSC062G12]|nr:proteasome ATPase [Actinomyces sp. HMSC062G12]